MTRPLANDLYLRALARQPTERTPAWIMRQAGRYLPEYRATRARAGSFMALCQNPELACEVTLQPLARFPLDAAILFSDILTVPDAMGLGLSFAEGEGPRFAHPVRSVADIERLAAPDPEVELRYVMDAVRTIRRALDGRVPLIGFSGSPWTLACYMVEGSGSKDFHQIKTLMYREPRALQRLLDVLTEAVTLYLSAQIAAGAQAVMIFDTWGGNLTAAQYPRFSLAPMLEICQRLPREAEGRTVPRTLFTKGGGQWLPQILAAAAAEPEWPFEALGLDWTVDAAAARRIVGGRVALQGNMDPAALLGDEAAIRAEVDAVLAAFGPEPGHVFNLGHGITPNVPPEHLGIALDQLAVHSRRA